MRNNPILQIISSTLLIFILAQGCRFEKPQEDQPIVEKELVKVAEKRSS